jgi:pyrroline-5-carboxylate reductase
MIKEHKADKPILLFGCGNMGRAMLDGWLAAGVDPHHFIIVDPQASNLPHAVGHYRDASELDQKFSALVLAIKPQMFDTLAADIEALLTPDALVVSILAGTRTAVLSDKLPGRFIVRLMPNLAAALGKSPLGLFAANMVDRPAIEAMLAPLGKPFWLKAEEQMDAVTALAGSGPAFVYRFIDALAKGGEALGLESDQSLALAIAMIEGGSALATNRDASPSELADRVTSPGGTTAAGLAVLDQDRTLEKLVEATLRAARDRGVELSGG